MGKRQHEIRDPIHNFVVINDQERDLINSRPFQRLRHIHQLGMSHFLYPGANHTRFEHSLGVMELATMVFDRIVQPPDDDVGATVRQALPILADRDQEELRYWRRTLRMAALCHDLGHLPFSHAAEVEMLPDGCDHESVTAEFIESPELSGIWSSSLVRLDAAKIAKLAVGPGKLKDSEGDFDPFEAILAEIIVGDAFGVDRMDYLLRDSLHAGVAYGKFDHHRLVQTLRIMPRPLEGPQGVASDEPALGVDEGGVHAAEALLLARYFMFTQVYLHHVRRIYDIHLIEFLREWLPGGRFPTSLDEYVALTDNEVMAALREAAQRPSSDCQHQLAQRVMGRRHFRRIYWPSPEDIDLHLAPAKLVEEGLACAFGAQNVRSDTYGPRLGSVDYPVCRDGQARSSIAVSPVTRDMPPVRADYVFVNPDLRTEAESWLEANRDSILRDQGPCNGRP